MKVILFGATGNVGRVLLNELNERGHEVTAIVREKEKFIGVAKEVIVGDVKGYKNYSNDIPKDSVIISAMGPVYGNEQEFSDIMKDLVDFSKEVQGKRLIVVGGAGSVYVAEGLRLVDTETFPKDWKPIANAHVSALETLKNSGLNWTYFSPAAFFEPGEKKGQYRLGETNLLADKDGNSKISFGDYAHALVNELENVQNERKQFTIAY